MELPANTFKRRLLAGELQIGLWCSLASNIAAEIVADSGFDWLLLDTEHTPAEVPDVLSALQAVQGRATSPIIRPAWNDTVLIKRVLDIGAQTIIVPYVQNADEARRAVEATRYPPQGVRGVTGVGRAARYGRVNNYLRNANSEMCVLVQVETRRALTEIEAIAAVDGVDGIFIGPSDLSASFGLIGQPGHEDVQRAIQDAGRRIRDAGKGAGILTGLQDEARRYIGWGYNFVAVGTDIALLSRAADSLARSFKG
ncbi:MAG: HpcH/HpaI aldolase/citrate lyase family protein [Hyphomicrobiaceae bacterium]